MPKVMKVGFVSLVSLLTAAGVCAAFGGQARSLIDDAFVLRVEESMARSLLSATTTNILQSQMVVTLRYPPAESRDRRFHLWSVCGWGSAAYPAQRVTKLPVDPILILADGYRKCRTILATLLEPRVPVGFYPAGHFGDFVYEGVLISDRLEFSDEPELLHLFGLLAETAKEPESDWAWYFDGWDDPDLKLADYRNKTGFTPELLFEFVGDTTVRVEISLSAGRLLVQTGDRWEMYALDQRSAAALQKLVTAKQAQRRQTEPSQTSF